MSSVKLKILTLISRWHTVVMSSVLTFHILSCLRKENALLKICIQAVSHVIPKQAIGNILRNQYSQYSRLPLRSTPLERLSLCTIKVLLSNDTIPPLAIELLQPECDVTICKDERDDVMRNIPGVDALFWASYDVKLDKELLERAGPQLKVIATMSAGYDNVDTEELKKRNIRFGNTPGIVGGAVSEQAIMLALAASRRLNEGRMALESSTWSNNLQWLMGMEISGSTVGIVGLGSIGQAIVKRLKGFDVEKFLYTVHREKPESKSLDAEFVSLDTLVSSSDFIFACVPLTEETERMFNYKLFSKMKKTSVFVNVGRGGSVNQEDLVRALKENLIFAAGLDVMTPEPLPLGDELLKLPNCVIAPHLGTATWKTTNKMAELTVQNILRALKGLPMLTPVI